jgi:hypothetical protein
MTNITNDTRYESSADSSGSSESHAQQNWTKKVLESSKKDNRKQPWKATFGDNIDNRLDDGEDYVEIIKTEDPAAAFRCKNSTLAA